MTARRSLFRPRSAKRLDPAFGASFAPTRAGGANFEGGFPHVKLQQFAQKVCCVIHAGRWHSDSCSRRAKSVYGGVLATDPSKTKA